MNKKKVPINVTYNPHEVRSKKWSKEYEKYRKKWNENPQKYKVEKFPLHLDIEITSRCNYHCDSCAFNSADAPYPIKSPGDMDYSLYQKIIDEGAERGLYAIKLNFRGEPLLHPRIVEMVQYAKQRGIIDVMFNTNGALLTPKLCKELIDAGLDKILFSVDTCNENKYKLIRKGGHFNKVYRNIQDMWVIRELGNFKNPQITVNRIDFPGVPREEIDQFVKLFSKIADVIGFQEWLDYHHCEVDPTVNEWVCAFPWQRMVILEDGTVLTCCGMPHPDKVLGNVKEQDIESMWHSARMNTIREMYKRRRSDLIFTCSICPVRNKLMYKT